MSRAEVTEAYPHWLQTQRRPDVPQGEAFDPWQLRILNPDEFQGLGLGNKDTFSARQLGYLTSFGVLAPSTHNVNPQRFRLGDNSIEILVDTATVLPQSDPHGRQVGVSIGCTIDNVQRAARSYGLQPQFEGNIFDEAPIRPLNTEDESSLVSIGTIHLTHLPDAPDSSRWLQAMLERKVVRALYDETKLAPDVVEQIQQRAHERYPTLGLHILQKKDAIHTMGKLQEDADRDVYEREEFLAELGQWFHLNSDTSTPNGMRGREFGFDDASTQRFHDGFNQRATLLPDEIAGFARSGRDMIRSSSAVGIVTLHEDTPQERIRAGQLYEELSLYLHMREYCTAMHAATTEVSRPRRRLQAFLGTDQTPALVFRIGMPEKPEDRKRAHSARPKPHEIILP